MAMMPLQKVIPRLFYLAVEHHPPQPPKTLLRYLPQSDLLAAGASTGVNGAATLLRVRKTQLTELYKLGESPNRGTKEEYQILVAELVAAAIDEVREELTFNEYLGLMENLNRYVNHADGQLIVPYEEVDLGKVDPAEVEDIAKWDSGYTPIDQIVGGLYQGLLLLMMRPGAGKTSHMMALAEQLRRNPYISNIWFFEAEIPRMMMLYRFKPIFQRSPFRPGDRLVCGFVDIREIVERCIAHPDPQRVIFIDSPDAVATGADKRLALEDFYRQLNWIKSVNKLIVVSSQPRRKQETMSQESVAESWAKAWYSDMIVTGNKLGRVAGSPSMRRVSFRVGKNRFGIDGNEVEFSFDYANLTFEDVNANEEVW